MCHGQPLRPRHRRSATREALEGCVQNLYRRLQGPDLLPKRPAKGTGAIFPTASLWSLSSCSLLFGHRNLWPDLRGTHGSPWSHPSVQCLPCPYSFFPSHICEDRDDRRDVLLPEIASYLVLQNDMDNHLFEATQSRNRSSQLTISNRFTLKNQFM